MELGATIVGQLRALVSRLASALRSGTASAAPPGGVNPPEPPAPGAPRALPSGRWIEVVTLLAVVLQHASGFGWVVRTWRDATYESFGFLALALLLPSLLSAPPRRESPSTRYLAALLGTALLDLALAPLGLNLVSALLGVLRLHLWALAFRVYPGPFWRHAQLWLGLLTLPVVHWGNVLVGFRLQQLVTAVAAGGLRLYGLPAQVHGTSIEVLGATVAVDASCSGLRLIYSGVLFGLLVLPRLRRRRLLFAATLLLGLLGANVVRVISLASAQLRLGRPLGPTAHEWVGLIAFALACALSLLVRPGARKEAPEARRARSGATNSNAELEVRP